MRTYAIHTYIFKFLYPNDFTIFFIFILLLSCVVWFFKAYFLLQLVVVVYVIVVLWLVSANFRSSLAAMASNSGRTVMGQMVGPLPHLRDDGELEV